MGGGRGYAGYVPAKIADVRWPACAAHRQSSSLAGPSAHAWRALTQVLTAPMDLAMKKITNPATFETIKKVSVYGVKRQPGATVCVPTAQPRALPLHQVTQNVAQHPAEAKYRKLKLGNEKIAALLVAVDGAVETLLEQGWQRVSDEDGDCLVLPAAKHLSMADVRRVEQGAERLAEALKVKARSEARARVASADPEKERIRLQMEADRRERAARGPVTTGSVAQPLPGSFGANTQGAAASGSSHGSGPVQCVHDEAAWRSLLAQSKPVLVDFTATWCGPCKMISPVFEQLAGQNAGKIIFAKVDVDEAQDVARACGVTSMPTFQLHKGGKLVSSFSGADPQRLQALVAEALKL